MEASRGIPLRERPYRWLLSFPGRVFCRAAEATRVEQLDQLIDKTKTDVVRTTLDKVNDKEFVSSLPALEERRKKVIFECLKCEDLEGKITNNIAQAEARENRIHDELDKFKLKYDEINLQLGVAW